MLSDWTRVAPGPATGMPVASRPRVQSIDRARYELGNIGKTRFYEVAHQYGIRLLKFGRRTVVATEDIDRVVDEILAGGEGKSNAEQPKAAAAMSVVSRCHVYAIELNPAYVDVAVKRWQTFTGQTAILESTGKSFEETDTERYSSAKDCAASYDAGIDAMRQKLEDGKQQHVR